MTFSSSCSSSSHPLLAATQSR